MATTTMTTSAATAAAVSTTMSATAAAPRQLNGRLRRAETILVEDMESRQADVGDFFFVERVK